MALDCPSSGLSTPPSLSFTPEKQPSSHSGLLRYANICEKEDWCVNSDFWILEIFVTIWTSLMKTGSQLTSEINIALNVYTKTYTKELAFLHSTFLGDGVKGSMMNFSTVEFCSLVFCSVTFLNICMDTACFGIQKRALFEIKDYGMATPKEIILIIV